MSAAAIAILEDTKLDAEAALDKALSLEGLPEPLLRRFAAYCAAEALYAARVNDARCWKAIVVTISFSLGKASREELEAAGAAAGDAAWAAAWDAAIYAAIYAARAAAWAAAGAAARAAAWAAAGDAAGDAARAAARAAQRAKLLSMLRGESDFLLEDLAMFSFKQKLKALL